MIKINLDCPLTPDNPGHHFTKPLLPLVDLLRDHGVDWSDKHESYDLVWAHQKTHVKHTGPVILQLMNDAGTVPGAQSRNFVKQHNVVSVVRHAKYQSCLLSNMPVFESTLHGALLWKEMYENGITQIPLEVQKVQFTQDEYDKMVLGFNWLFFPNCDIDVEVPEVDRYCDLSFIGTTYYGRHHVRWHRCSLIYHMERLAQKYSNIEIGHKRQLRQPEYINLLRRTKVAMSPWGFGETCIRDIEILMSGCLMIKPATPFTHTWPEYHHFETVFYCNWDFSDLEEVYQEALSKWDSLKEKRREIQQYLRSQRSNEILAQRVADIVKGAHRNASGLVAKQGSV